LCCATLNGLLSLPAEAGEVFRSLDAAALFTCFLELEVVIRGCGELV
jgi:hypothetical protein